MPRSVRMSARVSLARWVVIPGRRWLVGAVTWKGVRHSLRQPYRATADSWLRTALGPQARTAAQARAMGVVGAWPTA